MALSGPQLFDGQPATEKHDVEASGELSDDSGLSEIKPWDATRFSKWRKIHIICAGFTCTFIGNFGSSVPSGALDAISAHFGVTRSVDLILLNSLYMVGYFFGPLIFGPLCEYLGRRPVLLGTYLGYVVFMIASALSPNYTALLVFRLLCGFAAAAPTRVLPGLYADILDDPATRGNAIAVYMAVTTTGPLSGPIVSGFSSTVSWSWPFWIASIMAGAGLPLVLTLPETYAPVLHNQAIKKRLKQGRQAGHMEDLTLNKFDVRQIFFRPLKFLFTEPIVFFTAIYLTLLYSVFYLMFQAYPVVFQDFYGLSSGMASLAYIPLIIGNFISLAMFFMFTWYHKRAVKAGAEWTKKEVYRRLPLACIASPCMVIGLFWLAWTPWPSVSPIVPALSGLWFGTGYLLVFMGTLNYMTDVFRQDSASAQAGASMMRSFGAVVLPLSNSSMYASMGLHWAPSMLAFLALAMGVIPFIFLRYGDRLVRTSKATAVRAM